MKIKKLLIIKLNVTEIKMNENIIKTHYDYPKYYNAQHARHICYNFSGAKKLKGGHLAEGMVIYEAKEKEIKELLKEEGVEEISYNQAIIKGKRWKPKMTINTTMGKVEEKAFDIKNWIKDESEFSKNIL